MLTSVTRTGDSQASRRPGETLQGWNVNPETVLVISPQPWDHIPVSKHNYAIALARRGYQVVFLNPPDADRASDSRIVSVVAHPRLRVISYRRPWFYQWRFHCPAVFDWLMKRYMLRLLRLHRVQPDLVWCFEPNLFVDLSIFGAIRSIYHPVDPLSDDRHVQPARVADVVVTVSSRIAGQLASSGRTVHVVNHGLASPFEQLARDRFAALNSAIEDTGALDSCRIVQVGYAGNLCRRPVNRVVLRRLVMENPGVHFNFWGPASACGGDAAEFVAFLREQPHVTLHGAVSQQQLAEGFRAMDMFLLTYVADPKESDRSNSHKILEYLSTGRVVVSSRIETYAEFPSLLVMSDRDDDDDLPLLFRRTLADLAGANSVSRQLERIRMALGNTYDRQIDRIFEHLRMQFEL